MSIDCYAREVAIYVPPAAASAVPPEEALESCRQFLECVADEAAAEARLYDDRAATIELVGRGMHTEATGNAPAFESLLEAVSAGDVRVVLMADLTALARIPGHPQARSALDDRIELVEAALVLVSVPTPDELGDLQIGDARIWRELLEPLSLRRPTRRGASTPPLVGAPREVVEALLSCDTLPSWCRIASEAAPEALAEHGKLMQAQAVRHFETWLRDGVERYGLIGDPEAAYWEAIKTCHTAIARGEWHVLADQLAAAISKRESLGFDGSRTLESRLSAALHFGRRSFKQAWEDFGAATLLETLFGGGWGPSAPIEIATDVSEEEGALRYVAFLLTRAQNAESPELRQALDRLAAVLPAEQALTLRNATGVQKKTAKRRKS